MDNDDGVKSRFTYRDLRHMSQFSVHCPLRVITLLDFDCFYAQCEAVRLGLPQTQPLGVQQFKHVIAINYPARDAGLKKVVTVVEAREKCPNIVLQHVPTWRAGDDTWRYRDDMHLECNIEGDKSSLDYYRLQSRRAIEVVTTCLTEMVKDLSPLTEHGAHSLLKVEKASIDEIFIDLSAIVHAILLQRFADLLNRHTNADGTDERQSLDERLSKPWTEVLDWSDDKLIDTLSADEHQHDHPSSDVKVDTTDWDDIALNIGSELVRGIRARIFDELKYTCSAGIARNKVVSKLAAGHNKPNRQTVVLSSTILAFLSSYKFTKLRGLGGKLGSRAVKAFNTEQICDLLPVTLHDLQAKLGSETGTWLYNTIRGNDTSEVTPRTQIQSMLSAKTFTPSIEGLTYAEKWLRIFAADIIGRIADVNADHEMGQKPRRPRTMVVHHQPNGRFGPTRSKQTSIPMGARLDAEVLFKLASDLLMQVTREPAAWPCRCLSIGVSDFTEIENKGHVSIQDMLRMQRPIVPAWSPKIPGDERSGSLGNSSSTSCWEQVGSAQRKRTLLDFGGFSSDSRQNDTDGVLDRHTHLIEDNKRLRMSSTPIHPQRRDSISEEGSYNCPTCRNSIAAVDVLEHLDWHAAIDLHNDHTSVR